MGTMGLVSFLLLVLLPLLLVPLLVLVLVLFPPFSSSPRPFTPPPPSASPRPRRPPPASPRPRPLPLTLLLWLSLSPSPSPSPSPLPTTYLSLMIDQSPMLPKSPGSRIENRESRIQSPESCIQYLCKGESAFNIYVKGSLHLTSMQRGACIQYLCKGEFAFNIYVKGSSHSISVRGGVCIQHLCKGESASNLSKISHPTSMRGVRNRHLCEDRMRLLVSYLVSRVTV